MGEFFSLPVNCEVCKTEYGETAIFKVYHHGPLGGHFLCCDCFPRVVNYDLSGIENKLSFHNKSNTCYNCKFKNKDIHSRKVFKVFWYGKYGGEYMCEKCIYDKKFRNKVR
tara:strand:+ start:6249 stop:6581 length:333 start_codon:yes stop_codon:yes gene_type:complete